MTTSILAYGFSPGPLEMMIIAGIALLLFGKRLPEVARSLGKGIVEFKKGVRGIEDEVDSATYNPRPAARPAPPEEREEVTAPKFEPPAWNPDDSSQQQS